MFHISILYATTWKRKAKMFSIVMPIDSGRESLIKKTVAKYVELGLQGCEFVFVTRSLTEAAIRKEVGSDIDMQTIVYEHTDTWFNPSRALNLGVVSSKYDELIITCPEVKPKTNVIAQLAAFPGSVVICKVFDEVNGVATRALVGTGYRDQNPAMYFLIKFTKKSILDINGWDEEFMKGYAYEDYDFGTRFIRAGLSCEMHDEIQAIHQEHPRLNHLSNHGVVNKNHFEYNNNNNIIKPVNGLNKYFK